MPAPTLRTDIVIAQAAVNTYLAIGNSSSPTSYTAIANIGDITGPGLSAAVVDVTSHSNTDPWRQKITTLLDGGEVTLPCYFVPSSSGDGGHNNASGLENIFTQRTLRKYMIYYPDPAHTTDYFSAYISKFSRKAPVAGVLTADVTFTLTGLPTLS